MRFMLICLLLFLCPAFAADDKPLNPRRAYGLIDDLFSDKARKRERAAKKLIESGDVSMVPALVETLFFSEIGREDAGRVLNALLETNIPADYMKWIGYLGSREDIQPKPGYLALKARLFGWIDPAFSQFLDPKHKRTLRPEEIVWGGVKKDGIPALKNPPNTAGSSAAFLTDDERVFGVSFNGESRAYPFRIMDWHEMVNDVVGGQPFSISYCTLCGAGIAFDTRRDGAEAFTFGSSGMLYRSNKLMYDQQTDTMWNNLTGEPAMGSLVGKQAALPVLPLTVTTWGDWKQRHPQTTVITRDTGYLRDYRPGAAYGSYFDSDRLMFPVWTESPEDADLDRKDWVWVVIVDGKRKAYPLRDIVPRPILHDTFNGKDLVLITDPTTEAVRVYATDGRQLARKDGAWVLSDGTSVTVGEDGISGDGVSMARLPGHRAYWFTWGAFFPNAEYYKPPAE